MKKSKIKQEFEILNSAISSLAARVKEIECSTKHVNEPLTELPDKWAINTQYSTDEAEFWFNSNINRRVNWGGYAHYPDIEKEVCTSHDLHPDYTEISFSDFERLVLKKGEIENIVETYPGQNNAQNQAIRRDDTICGVMETSINISKHKLEVGKWYKCDDGLICYQGDPDIDQGYATFKAYGFCGKEWIGEESGEELYNGWSAELYWKPATKEEVESALIEEAKRRGYKPDVNLFFYNFSFNILYDSYGIGRKIVFNNGQWATIVEDSKEEIDWSVPGTIVHDFDDWVMITGIHDEKTFKGVGVKTTVGSIIGDYFDAWPKDKFILFKGQITLSNEPI